MPKKVTIKLTGSEPNASVQVSLQVQGSTEITVLDERKAVSTKRSKRSKARSEKQAYPLKPLLNIITCPRDLESCKKLKPGVRYRLYSQLGGFRSDEDETLFLHLPAEEQAQELCKALKEYDARLGPAPSMPTAPPGVSDINSPPKPLKN